MKRFGTCSAELWAGPKIFFKLDVCYLACLPNNAQQVKGDLTE